MPTLIQQLKDLNTKRQTILDEAIAEVRSAIDALSEATGTTYMLVTADEIASAPGTTTKRRNRITSDSSVIRWTTSVTRSINYAKGNKLSKTQAMDGVRLALEKLASKKGVPVPADVIAAAEQAVAEAYPGAKK